MRASILSRSVIAIASLALGSAALAATPATAATPPSTSRDLILSIASDVRAADVAGVEYPIPTFRRINRLIERGCGFELDGLNEIDFALVRPAEPAGPVADGLIVMAWLTEYDDGAHETHRTCTFAALATTNAAFSLGGDVELTIEAYDNDAGTFVPPATTSSRMSGDTFLTPARNLPGPLSLVAASFAATGSATRPFYVTKTEKVPTPKTTKQIKAAKKTYNKKKAAAKKAYNKAVKKAGKSKKQKTAALKAHNKKKAAAKVAYKKAIARFKIVTTTTGHSETRPFTLGAEHEVP